MTPCSYARLTLLSCALICVVGVSTVSGQTTAASLTGTIRDTSGSIVPGATVTIINAATEAVTWDGTTDENGNYFAPSLPPGTYNVTVTLEGFKTVSTSGVRLEVSQRARLDSVLAVGGVDETVNVVGETAARLETEDSSIGLVINTSQVQGLPLPSRNVLNLLTLAGGVSSGGAATGTTGITSSQLSINGSRTLNSEFMIDGVSVVSGSTGAPNRLPSTDAIREFKVLAASYSAEYGRSAGGVISAVTDSGGNRFTGGAWEYYRHEKLNENNYFNKLRNQPKPTDRYSQFGGKLGGPVMLPGYDGSSKTFFFAVYEGLRRTAPSTVTSTVPDERFRLGDFSAASVPIIDPLTGQPFPGNIIPQDRIDPAARKIMSLLPAPNSSGTSDGANGRRTNNYVNDLTNKPKEDEITARVDHNLATNSRLNVRYTQYKLFNPSSPTMPGPLDNAAGDSTTKGYQTSVGWTEVWSPSVITETSFGFLRDDPVIDPPTLGVNVNDVFGIARSTFAAAPRFRMTTGWRELGNNENTYRRQINNNYQLASSLTWLRGAQTIKSGVQYRLNQFDVFNPGGLFTGAYDFTGEITSSARVAGNPVNALADFLLGQVKTASYDVPQPETGRRNFNLGLFVQDDWKVSSKLTLNLGLRYEYESPMWIDNDVHSRLDIDPASVGRLLVAGQNASRTLDLKGDKLNFAPRVGGAYALNEKTVLRSAFGLFYGQIFSNLGGVVLYPGFTLTRDFSSRGTGVPQPFTLSQGHPIDVTQNDDPFLAERNATPQQPLVDNSNQFGSVSPLPYGMQWNAGIQRELWGGTIVDLSYVGSHGAHLPVVRNFNTVPIDRLEDVERANSGLVTQQNRPNPNVSSFAAFVHEGTSDYHSMQLRASRRFTEKLGFQASYTLARSTDDGSGIFNFSQPNGLEIGDLAGAVDPDVNRGPSALDRTHAFSGAILYTTSAPWAALRNIQVNAIVIARSGTPSRITQTNLTDWNRMAALPTASAQQQRPNLIGNIDNLRLGETVQDGTSIRYLNPTTDPNFPLAPSGPVFANINGVRTLVLPFTGAGTLERGVIRDPGEFNIDLAIARRFPLGGRMGVTVRAEAFNVLDTVNLNGPGANNNLTVTTNAAGQPVFNAPNFGLITTAKSARFIQLVTRFDF